MTETGKTKRGKLDFIFELITPKFTEYAFALRQLSLLVSAGHALNDAALLLGRNASSFLRSALKHLQQKLVQTQLSGHRRGDLLGDYLREFLSREIDPKKQANALQAVGGFLHRVGEEVNSRREQVRSVTRPIWLFGLTFILFAPNMVPYLETKIAPGLSDAGTIFLTSTQIGIALAYFSGSYQWVCLLITVLFSYALRWIWLKGWLPGAHKQLVATRSILLGEALITLNRIGGQEAIGTQSLARLLPQIVETISLRRQFQTFSSDLLLVDALERTRGIPNELIAAVQAGIDSDNLETSLESFLALQASRQRIAEGKVRRVGQLIVWLLLMLFFTYYFVTIDLSLMQALFVGSNQ